MATEAKAAIVTGAHMLARLPEAPEKTHRIAERINQSARRMTVMIRDILDYTRGRLGGGIPLKRQPTDLVALSQSVIEEIRAGHPTARIEAEMADKLIGDWDPARIEQALSNLIANAVQHGGPDVRLVAAEEAPDTVVVTVRNGGHPIPEAQLPSLFEAFKKGDNNPAGLGLGLFITREIVHAHQGSIDVSSSAAGTVSPSACRAGARLRTDRPTRPPPPSRAACCRRLRRPPADFGVRARWRSA